MTFLIMTLLFNYTIMNTSITLLEAPKPMTDIGLMRMIHDMIIDHQKGKEYYEQSVTLSVVAQHLEDEIVRLVGKEQP